MPAIAPIEDLRAAQKKGLSINAMLHALCARRYVCFDWERTPEQLKGEGG